MEETLLKDKQEEYWNGVKFALFIMGCGGAICVLVTMIHLIKISYF